MRESHDGIYAFPIICLCFYLLYDILSDAIDTAHRRDHPQFVPHADKSVGAAITLEGSIGMRCCLFLWLNVDVVVVQLSTQIGLDVVVIEQCSFCNVVDSMTDGETVFHDHLSRLDVMESYLVSGHYVSNQFECRAVDVNDVAGLQCFDGYGDIVCRVDYGNRQKPIDAGAVQGLPDRRWVRLPCRPLLCHLYNKW